MIARKQISCACGCGTLIFDKDERGRSRKYAYMHHVQKPRTEAQLEASKRTLERYRPPIAWNKGKTYVLASCAEYAHKSAWTKAMKRLYGDQCMRCGWDEAPCDSHHIEARRNGGKYMLSNGVLLCPNCHRLAEMGKITAMELRGIRDSAMEVCERR